MGRRTVVRVFGALVGVASLAIVRTAEADFVIHLRDGNRGYGPNGGSVGGHPIERRGRRWRKGGNYNAWQNKDKN